MTDDKNTDSPNDTPANDTPENITQLANRCVVHVRNKYGFEPDFTSETLSILDHFVASVLEEEGRGTIPEPGSKVRAAAINLFAPMFGAYLGQTMAKEFGGRWRRTDLPPENWRFEFENFFLAFNPVGAAASIFNGDWMVDFGQPLLTMPKLMPKLDERLNAAPEVDEKDFFTFCTYFESIQIAADFLQEVNSKEKNQDCSAKSYDFILGNQQPRNLN